MEGRYSRKYKDHDVSRMQPPAEQADAHQCNLSGAWPLAFWISKEKLMCGIALIVSGVGVHSSDASPESLEFVSGFHENVEDLLFSVDDLKSSLFRRGPDGLGSQKISLCKMSADSANGKKCERETLPSDHSTSKDVNSLSSTHSASVIFPPELYLLGAELQLTGTRIVRQPLVDTAGNHLVFNGEIFGGIDIKNYGNDAETLLAALALCCSCEGHAHSLTCNDIRGRRSVPQLLSSVRGPWAFIYWQSWSRTMWFGRDVFGRRSLLVHWPTLDDPRFLLSSVSPPYSTRFANSTSGRGIESLSYWEELSCGIYSLSFSSLESDIASNNDLICEFRTHEWVDVLLSKLIKRERVDPSTKFRDQTSRQLFLEGTRPLVDPSDAKEKMSSSSVHGGIAYNSVNPRAREVLISLRESVIRRTTLSTVVRSCKRRQELVPVAVLFSGGLDSMILAALLHQCLNLKYEIDLLNVSFEGHLAPDRISAKAGLMELQKFAPCRKWRLVEIDADLSNLAKESKHVMSLINPAKTYMDLNIGIALWLAASGDGWVYETNCSGLENDVPYRRHRSEAKVLLVGTGADEQCAGYSRYRTKYREGSWAALEEEMRLDMQRIWKRNLGRDDRCISDHGKEARFPFLDENFVKLLLEIPLEEIVDFDQPVGKGDKKILREVAHLLGLEGAAALPKRAIQFGSRIARESNKRNFGSNRAANQVSAGYQVIHDLAE